MPRHCQKVILLMLIVGVGGPTTGLAEPLQEATNTVIKTNRAARNSQNRIDKVSDVTQQLLEKYRAATWEAQQLQLYNEQLEAQIAAQKGVFESLDRQIAEVEITQREILPLMNEMLDTLHQFIELDLPFRQDERLAVVSELKEQVDNAEISVPERFRHLLEAWQRETDYGGELETWRQPLDINKQERVVDMLRIGRVGLYYLSLDGKHAGAWDRTTGRWEVIGGSEKGEVRRGLRIAKDKLAPALLELPLSAPVDAPATDVNRETEATEGTE